jgi:hypothetical protein
MIVDLIESLAKKNDCEYVIGQMMYFIHQELGMEKGQAFIAEKLDRRGIYNAVVSAHYPKKDVVGFLRFLCKVAPWMQMILVENFVRKFCEKPKDIHGLDLGFIDMPMDELPGFVSFVANAVFNEDDEHDEEAEEAIVRLFFAFRHAPWFEREKAWKGMHDAGVSKDMAEGMRVKGVRRLVKRLWPLDWHQVEFNNIPSDLMESPWLIVERQGNMAIASSPGKGQFLVKKKELDHPSWDDFGVVMLSMEPVEDGTMALVNELI